MRTMTVCIPSHRRPEALRRLVRSLAEQVRIDPALGEGLDVLVVLDGGCAESERLVTTLDTPMRVRIIQQGQRWLAATRNHLAQDAHGDILLFLDDDMVPAPGLLAIHRGFHERRRPAMLIGRWAVPEYWTRAEPNASGDASAFAESIVGSSGRVERFDRFSFANTSVPRVEFLRIGGFDEAFVGYGEEDSEFGIRALRSGLEVMHDPSALAWHLQERTLVEDCHQRIEAGRNLVRMARKYPDLAAAAFPAADRSAVRTAVMRVCAGRPNCYRAFMWSLMPFAYAQWHLAPSDRSRFVRWVRTAALLSGMTDLDPAGDLVKAWFGQA